MYRTVNFEFVVFKCYLIHSIKNYAISKKEKNTNIASTGKYTI